jgi:hypothetical protein
MNESIIPDQVSIVNPLLSYSYRNIFCQHYNIWGGSIDSWRIRYKTPYFKINSLIDVCVSPTVNSQVYYLILGCYN